MDFAKFIQENKEEIREQSDSVAMRRVDGVPVVNHSDEWLLENEWLEVYESLVEGN